MNKETIKKRLPPYIWPGAMVLLGLVLLFSPDTASALIAKILGWICVLAGVYCGIAAISGADRKKMTAAAILCLGLGAFIIAFPLSIAQMLGRVFGLFLVALGAGNIRESLMKKKMDLPYELSLGVAIATVVAGVVLFLLPMTLSRVLLNICGGVLVVIGILSIVKTYREQKLLESGDGPDIIDAEP